MLIDYVYAHCRCLYVCTQYKVTPANNATRNHEWNLDLINNFKVFSTVFKLFDLRVIAYLSLNYSIQSQVLIVSLDEIARQFV